MGKNKNPKGYIFWRIFSAHTSLTCAENDADLKKWVKKQTKSDARGRSLKQTYLQN